MYIKKSTIENYIDVHWNEILEDIQQMVAIPSTMDKERATSGQPWGPNVAQALTKILDIASRLGFATHNYGGYVGCADLKPTTSSCKNKKQIAVFSHVDTVPAGAGWNFEPYALTKKDGYLCGRGVVDDKGPSIITLWAAHFFIDFKQDINSDLRIIFGTNEESGMEDLKYYRAHFKDPYFLFTPDSYWPVVIGEKGTYNAEISFPLVKDGRIIKFEGGTVRNAVASEADVIIRGQADGFIKQDNITITQVSTDSVCLHAIGVGGHASEPQKTKSAIGMLVDYLYDYGIYTTPEKKWLELQRKIYHKWDGSLLNIDAVDSVFSPLTIISGVIGTHNGKLIQSIDCRFPKSTNPDTIYKKLSQTCMQHDAFLKETHRGHCMFVDPKQEEIQILLSSYREWTATDEKPITLGGGTHAKHFPYAVAFGPEHLEDGSTPSWLGSIHAANEGISENALKKALAIYITALGELLQ